MKLKKCTRTVGSGQDGRGSWIVATASLLLRSVWKLRLTLETVQERRLDARSAAKGDIYRPHT